MLRDPHDTHKMQPSDFHTQQRKVLLDLLLQKTGKIPTVTDQNLLLPQPALHVTPPLQKHIHKEATLINEGVFPSTP